MIVSLIRQVQQRGINDIFYRGVMLRRTRVEYCDQIEGVKGE
jgi:hypothetical protein